MLPYLTFFDKQVPSYGLMLITGFCAGLIVALLRRKINGLTVVDVLVAMLLAGAGALLGGKVFFVIQGLPQFLSGSTGMTFLQYFNYAGLVYYGGFIGCILMVLLFSAIYQISFWKVLDTLIPALPLAQAFGRVGCFLAGCCYGIPFEHGFTITAPLLEVPEHGLHLAQAPRGVPLLPVQLIESACVLVLFFIMLYYGRKPRKPGKLFSMYLIGYGTIRFILEFFRYDAARGIYASLSVSQWISLVAIALGIILAVFFKPKEKPEVPPVISS